MKSSKILLSLVIALAFTFVLADQSVAQDDPRAQAVEKFNTAQEYASDRNFDNAISTYREALAIARDNDLDDIVERIEQNLPRVGFSRASTAYSEYQNDRSLANANEALEAFKAAQEIAEEFGDQQITQQARGAIPQLYYLRSVHEFRDDNYDAALADLATAIDMNANYAVAYYQKGVVMKAKDPDNFDGFMEWYDRAIEIAQQTDDSRTLNNARNGARDELIYRAVNLADERRFSRAIELLEKVEQYDPESADAHYRLAEIHNERGNWDQALQHAQRSLELETGGVGDRAKIYFELGTAYKGKGETSNACDAFENARHGDFTDPANHELQFELECPGHRPTGRR